MLSLSLLFAGLWAYIWQWGLAFVVMAGLLTAAVMSTAIPVIGPYLGQVRVHLAWAALAIALFMAGWTQGARTASARAEAKQVVIERNVTRAVKEAKDPSINNWPDRWDREDH